MHMWWGSACGCALVLRAARARPARMQGEESEIATVCWCCARADCGAGVGRVSEQLLLRHFAQVDLVEPSQHLLGTAQVRALKPYSTPTLEEPYD